MDSKTDSKGQNSSFDDPFQPDLQPDTAPGIGEVQSPELDLDNDLDEGSPEAASSSGGIGERLRNIERDGMVSMEASRNAGLAVMIGSTLYINEQHREIADAADDVVPEGVEVETYVPEELEDVSSEAVDILEQVESYAPEINEGSIDDYLPSEVGHIDLSDYSSFRDGLASKSEPIVDEIVKDLNTDVETWEGMGIDTSKDVIDQLSGERLADMFFKSFDNLAHLGITGTASNLVSQSVGKYTDRDSLVAAGGMSTALAFAVVKEGLYEGGPGVQFNPESIDVQGDWIADTIGAAWGTMSYLHNQAKEDALESEADTGYTGKAARKLGRAYERAKFMAGSNLPSWRAQEHLENYTDQNTGTNDVPEALVIESLEDLQSEKDGSFYNPDPELEMEWNSVDGELESGWSSSTDYEQDDYSLEGDSISVKDSYGEQEPITAGMDPEEMLETGSSTDTAVS